MLVSIRFLMAVAQTFSEWQPSPSIYCCSPALLVFELVIYSEVRTWTQLEDSKLSEIKQIPRAHAACPPSCMGVKIKKGGKNLCLCPESGSFVKFLCFC